ncbi:MULTISPECIES: UDP-N-acetylmuramoyl-tripeptide--D-alanyl-D-alanine ligase [unclassified Thermotoga]|uniref:UDP-N-acetylmuramoyl-tripeptide--D-alanyl-D- alanine ligase n=1 Tax=unclassified Thermotoga TaxID=2631113 RepID=UPI000543A21B|nr:MULTISPECIES: UDP-N-acetylmuramoyl-tripeptide--D-alanyl-D-alanine ligase [unclassified Thermotoga]KAF2959412.1 UDP-N-acetylmuramoylalanyl-D-glutamyl-2, 6-diaminopimelate--D-alanyl-D-alanine ligase [Thermotoga sp. 38H-to]KHC93292.1 UDP-N-acetylmuramoylalanyl-D-glutamyl-2,6-diaminopimelate--D-alanyl-D-alanyl ligase [Thermotoga sp. Mc24]
MKDLLTRRFVLNSKEVREGDVFVAVKGKRFDGHDFIDEALKNGAYAVIAERKTVNSDRIFLVESSVDALAKLAREKLGNFSGTVVGITGSSGKTTTKEILYNLLKNKRSVFKTPGNMNTEYGLPLSILNDYKGEEILILEMAASKPGDIAHLCKIAPPDIAVLLNVGNAHLEFFGTRERIMETKMEIIKYSKENATAVTFFDDSDLRREVPRYRKTLFFGKESGDSVLKGWWYYEGSTIAEFEAFESLFTVKLSGYWNGGQLLNIAASLCVMRALGETVDIFDLASLKTVPGRFNVREKEGVLIVDDTYNASPEAFQTSIEALLRFPGKKFAVVGAMKELGERSKEFHEELGKKLNVLDGVYVFLSEPEAEWIKSEKIILKSDDPEDIAKDLAARVTEGDVVLFKASRAVRIERVLEMFEKELERK